MSGKTHEPGFTWRHGIPIIRRDDSLVHLGGNPATITLTAGEATWIQDIGSHASWDEAQAQCPSGPGRANAILNTLRGLGAIAESDECWWLPPSTRVRLSPQLLALAQWHRDPQSAIAARSTWTVGIHGRGLVADTLRRVARECGVETSLDPSAGDIAIIEGPQGIIAPEALVSWDDDSDDHLLDRPHLPVSVHQGQVSVGPLVIPGSTPCLRCLYLHKCDEDQDWSTVVDQWRGATQAASIEADPLLAWQAAVTATAVLRGWIDKPDPTGFRRFRWRLPDPVPTVEQAFHHPACGCRWARPESRVETATGGSGARR